MIDWLKAGDNLSKSLNLMPPADEDEAKLLFYHTYLKGESFTKIARKTRGEVSDNSIRMMLMVEFRLKPRVWRRKIEQATSGLRRRDSK